MITRISKLTKLLLLSIGVFALLAWLLLKNYFTSAQQLSVKPPLQYSKVELKALDSSIGMHTKLPFSSIIAAAEHATVNDQSGKGEKQTCKKILGAKVCATLQWQYTISRDGKVEVNAIDERLQLRLPVSFSGVASVDGNGGKLLGLRNKDITGKLTLVADLDFTIAPNWCPKLESDLSYVWVSDPKIRLVGNIRINLRKSVDKALQRKLKDLQSTFSELIDCDEFRQSVAEQWHVHTLDVPINKNSTSQLHITPLNASISEIGIESDHVGIAFELGATIKLHDDTHQAVPVTALPDLRPSVGSPGSVEFSLLLEIPYQQLTDTITPKVVGKTYSSKDASNVIAINSIELYPSGELLTIDVGFSANIFRYFETQGNIYITAKPIADPHSNTLRLTELAFTRSMDSKVMSALTTVLRQKLLAALVDALVIDLGPSLRKIEDSVAKSLSDPTKTAGIPVDVAPPEVRLMALNPQADGIAAIVHLSTKLNATIAEDVLIR